MFRDTSVVSVIRAFFFNTGSPVVCYKYNKPFRNTVVNISKIVFVLKMKVNIIDSWECINCKLCYPAVGHDITDILNTDNSNWTIISKGPRYRSPSPMAFNKCRLQIEVALQELCKCWCKREYAESNAVAVRIYNATRHPRHIVAAAIVIYM